MCQNRSEATHANKKVCTRLVKLSGRLSRATWNKECHAFFMKTVKSFLHLFFFFLWRSSNTADQNMTRMTLQEPFYKKKKESKKAYFSVFFFFFFFYATWSHSWVKRWAKTLHFLLNTLGGGKKISRWLQICQLQQQQPRSVSIMHQGYENEKKKTCLKNINSSKIWINK